MESSQKIDCRAPFDSRHFFGRSVEFGAWSTKEKLCGWTSTGNDTHSSQIMLIETDRLRLSHPLSWGWQGSAEEYVYGLGKKSVALGPRAFRSLWLRQVIIPEKWKERHIHQIGHRQIKHPIDLVFAGAPIISPRGENFFLYLRWLGDSHGEWLWSIRNAKQMIVATERIVEYRV